ncbi:hypothetical protein UA31_09620 [Photobacterium angustum]|uniref:Uncharacterized protein n=1 Tax=Photobacterium angustum TaxID=661 RepID=A0A855SC97_PHOAN|nr:hypothetical protein UB36_09615 [Photobacterium damselae subsp. damselae]KJF95521.1 hypothetical protein UB39_05480 [Photobacterium angustum]KJG18342.1 hypothetical protein UA33_05775 [Photobacterium angustum]KJG26433.1 hypothetical protein UA39_01745 [Photobacterium angustum]KJG29214.1 hypothetical protein UA36_15390 [Photobacterium angustum]
MPSLSITHIYFEQYESCIGLVGDLTNYAGTYTELWNETTVIQQSQFNIILIKVAAIIVKLPISLMY